MKKGLIALWIVTGLSIVLLGANFLRNEMAIVMYEQSAASELKDFKRQTILQPYVYFYNQGNVYYKKADYEQAVKYYEKALKKHAPKQLECSIRINLVLAKLALIQKTAKEDEVMQVVDKLRECIDILTEDGCAAEERSGGHKEEAQQLKNEIEELIEDLLNGEPDVSNSTSEEEEPQPEQENSKEGKKQQQLEEKFREMENQGTMERHREINNADALRDYDFFNDFEGNRW